MNRLAMALVPVLLLAVVAGCSKHKCQSRQTEAKVSLQALHVAQKSYHEQERTVGMTVAKSAYAKTLADLKWAPSGDVQHYSFKIVSADENTFVAEAAGKGEMAGDVWRIDQTGTLTATKDKCQ